MLKKILLVSLLLSIACQKQITSNPQCPNWNPESLVYAAKTSVEAAMNASDSDEQISHAKKGMIWAERCAQSFPSEPGCYYYRAVATGLYYEKAPLHYQKGLKKIVADCEILIGMDPAYEQAGGYRVLGNVYLKVPSFALVKNGVTKDPEKALDYARKAIELAPHDDGNQLLLAEALVGNDEYQDALPHLKNLASLWSQKQNLSEDDKENLETVEKLIEKTEKRLTK